MERRMALIVGIDQYDDPGLPELTNPSRDVLGLAEVLTDPKIGQFEVSTVVNQESSTVIREIARFFKDKKPKDTLLLYFSGHGIRDEHGDLYLAMKDTMHDLLTATAIPGSFVTREMDRCRCKRMILILDCCHSGAFVRGAKSPVGGSVGTAPTFEGNGFGRVILTATDEAQFAWEGDQIIGTAGNSVFTHYLIEGLRSGEADLDANGLITLDELFNYADDKVRETTSKQKPGKWAFKQQGDLLIARSRRAPLEMSTDLELDLYRMLGLNKDSDPVLATRELVNTIKVGNPKLVSSAVGLLWRMSQVPKNRKLLQKEILFIPEGECFAGRNPDEPIFLDDPSVSRRHAGFKRENDHVWVTDLSSANGTYLDGNRLEPNTAYPLQEGASLVFGASLSFRILNPATLLRQDNFAPISLTGSTGGRAVSQTGLADPYPMSLENGPKVETKPCARCGRQLALAKRFCGECGLEVGKKVCGSCKTIVEPVWKICPKCRFQLRPEPLAKPRCGQCNREVMPTWKICPNCRNRLRG